MGAAAAAIIIAEKRMVEAFERAGATNANAARTPGELDVDSTALSWRRLVNRAVIRESSPGSGLYYLDILSWQATRRTRRRLAVALLVIILAVWFGIAITGVLRASSRLQRESSAATRR